MTHTTEQDRAEFEAWYIKSAKNSVPAFSAWSDIEVRDGCMRPDEESYKIDTARISWEAWKEAQRAQKLKGLQVLIGATAGVPEAIELARSRFIEAYGRSPLHDDLAYACLLIDAYGGAPSVPVPQGWKLVPVEPTEEMLRSMAGQFFGTMPEAKAAFDEALAAAPQPPEADHIPDAGKMVAVPVQMPEPVAAESRFTTFAGNRWRWCTVEHARAFGADKGYEVRYLYTEQQVRDLLAAHGIEVSQ